MYNIKMNSTTDWNASIGDDWGLSPHETIWSHSSSSSNSNSTSLQSPSLIRYSEAPFLSTPDDKVSLPQDVDVCKVRPDTPRRPNSLYRPRQIFGEIENLAPLKPIREENQYLNYYDNNPANYYWKQQPKAVNHNEHQISMNNDNLSFYDQLLRDENEPFQKEISFNTEVEIAKRQWNRELLNQVHHQGGYNKQFDNIIGRPICKTQNIQLDTQTYDRRSSVFTSTPTMPAVQSDIIPISPDFSKLSPTDGYKICTFCKKNGERPSVYTTHAVRAKVGRKYIVTCPILRRYVCIECGATGDDSHTISYCPLRKKRGETMPSTMMSLKKTKVKSNGDRRY